VSDFFCFSGSGVTTFATGAYGLGDRMVPAYGSADTSTNVDVARTAVWECTTAGTTNATPTWPASFDYDVDTVTQNGVVFTPRKPGYSSGSTVDWTFATPFLRYLQLAMATETPNGRGLVSDSHAETSALTLAAVPLGTLTNPAVIQCVGDNVTSNFVNASTAVVTTTSTGTIQLDGHLEIYGVNLHAGTGSATLTLTMQTTTAQSGYTRLENLAIRLITTGSNATISTNTTQSRQRVRWVNCTVSFGGSGQEITVRGVVEWIGGSFVSGTATPATLFLFGTTAGMAGTVYVRDVDFNNLSNTFILVSPTTQSFGSLTLENCKMPSGWNIDTNLVDGTITQPGFRVELVNCDVGDTNYRTVIEDCYGSIRDSTTVVATGGATDGTTLKSFRMSTSSQAGQGRWNGLETNPISIWNETVGSAQTATFELVSNTAALLTNAEFYTLMDYLGTSGFPLGTATGSYPATPLTTATNLTTSTKAWDTGATARANSTAYSLGDVIKLATNTDRIFFCTTAGTSNGSEPAGYASAVDGDSVTDGTAVFRAGFRQKVAIAFTAQEKGPVTWRHVLNKASTTVYVDRDVTLS
jgi:hypothetical protein